MSKPNPVVVIISTGKDRGMVSLLRWFDPNHKMWEATNGGHPIAVLDDGTFVTVH